jgi:Ca2+/H+ antiporter, TMEM165/GDT1 family
LLVLVAALGPALQSIPLARLQLVVGVLLLLFGMRWLRKAVLRAAGVIALHDEEAVFSSQTRSLSEARLLTTSGLDTTALVAAFKIVMLEGIEVVFIVLAIGATSGHLVIAGVGAAGAIAVVALLGLVLHRPLALVPENSLKFAVGVLLCAFGTFWSGEGIGIIWPGDDWSILALVAGFIAISVAGTLLCRSRPANAPIAD